MTAQGDSDPEPHETPPGPSQVRGWGAASRSSRLLPLPAVDWAEVVAAVPAALVLALAVVWSWYDGGYAATNWLPGAAFVLGLLVTVGVAGAVRVRDRSIVVALAALGAFTAWNYLSILWAQERAPAWDGSNRTLLYFCVFGVVASRRWSARTVGVLVGGYALAVAVVIGYWVERATTGADPGAYFILGRLASPIAYPNAEAALAIAAAWPAAALAARRSVSPVIRGLLLAAAGLLLEAALLAQSRATLVAVPIALAVYFLVVPARLRAATPIVLLAAAVGASWHALASVYLPLVNGRDAASELADARHVVALSVVGLFFAGTLLGLVDRAVRVPVHGVRVANVVALAVLVLAAGGTGAAAVARYGSPVTRLEEGWRHFKSGGVDDYRRTHFVSGLGSKRYDLWRVAVLQFTRHPLAGTGSDNYAAAYVRERRSTEEPLYPHSFELRLLSQTGVVGTLLFAVFLGATGVAWWRTRRTASPAVRAASVAAGMVFVYWLVHGSVDWFWEIPALGTPAMAALALAARTRDDAAPVPASSARAATGVRRRPWIVPLLLAGGLVGAASLGTTWASAEQVDAATTSWRADPARAFHELSLARRLNPLSEQPDVVAGVIAGKLGDVAAERRSFARAVARNPLNWYAHLRLGLVEASQGRRSVALAEVREALRLDPRDPIIRATVARVRRGAPVDVAKLEQEFAERTAILQKQRHLDRPARAH